MKNIKTFEQHVNESKLNESKEELYHIYFVTPMYPDLEDGEGWTSYGKDEDDAWMNLLNYFKNELTPKRGKNLMQFWKTQIVPKKGKVDSREPFKQFQG